MPLESKRNKHTHVNNNRDPDSKKLIVIWGEDRKKRLLVGM